MVYFPSRLYAELCERGCFDGIIRPPVAALTVNVRGGGGERTMSFVSMGWRRFLASTDPDDIRWLCNRYME